MKHSKKGMFALRRLVVCAIAFTLVGCRSDIPKQDMEAIAAWSKAACKCAEQDASKAKSCTEDLKKPSFDLYAKGLLDIDLKYKQTSTSAYSDIRGIGETCALKVDLSSSSKARK